MTGVPQASASTTDRPNGSSKLMRWSNARADPRVFRARRAADRAKVDHSPVVECGRDLLIVIILILDDAGHDQFPSGSTCRCDRFSGTLVRGMRPKKSRSSLPYGWKGKVLQRNAMVDRCCIAQVRMAIGLADRDIVDAIFVLLEAGRMR